MALSGQYRHVRYLSAFGAKRTCAPLAQGPCVDNGSEQKCHITESRSLTVVENAYCAYLAIANPNLAPVVTLFDRGFSSSASNFGHGGAGPWAGCYDHPVEELAPAMCGGFSYPAFLHRLQEKAPALAGGG
jgi:hypothetical protein